MTVPAGVAWKVKVKNEQHADSLAARSRPPGSASASAVSVSASRVRS
ncbi:hypothetical protein AB0M45_31265 [Nocardia sp. NPDC051787]